MLTAFVMISLSLGAPAEWRCYADLYGDGYSCDCGCGIVDPDCGYPEGEFQDFAACAGHNCGPGTVPLQGSPGMCVPNVCGDGFAGKGEACDDRDGPGCDETCQIVTEGYRCSGLGAGCGVPVCGDGIVDMDRGERCDDGDDDIAGDGCVQCVPEPGFMCRLFGGCYPTTCGDGMIEFDWDTQSGESCEDGNTLPGDGCDAFCRGEPGWVCTWEGCVEIVCGDGIVARGDFGSGEQCDDANTVSGDGCDGQCFVEPGWFCDDWMGCQQQICGDGVLQPTESCDDANDLPGDGCDGCLTEAGWSCANEAQVCKQVICGDGLIMSDDTGTLFEECDDSNTIDGDGCDMMCRREPGFVCLADGTCRPIVCGDGFVDASDGVGPGFPGGPKKAPIDIPIDPGGPGGTTGGDEACDDGNVMAGDGCSDVCQVEDGYVCETPGVACVFPVCSDGLVQGAETCDDGNDAAGDGCNNACQREAGYVCRVPGQACEPMPRAWVCSSIIYGSGDGCDCGCGAADPDCATPASRDDCQFNHCLEAAPYPSADDPSQCDTEQPPVEVTPEVVEVVEEGGPVEEDGEDPESEPQPEVAEAEPSSPTAKDDGCAGGGALSLLGLVVLLRRRRA